MLVIIDFETFYSTRKSGIKKLWWCPSKRLDQSCIPEITFSKKEFQIWEFESFYILIFWSKFHFLGDCFRALKSVLFLFFIVGQPWWPTFLLSPPHPHPHPPHPYALLKKFIEIRGWLLLRFFICLHNQLSAFNSIIVQMSEKRDSSNRL